MDKMELIQNIGNEVCEGCGPEADCGINPADCSRIDDAIALLDQYISKDACAAAAPDLLSACEEVLRMVRDPEKLYWEKSHAMEFGETAIDVLHKAISKAKGK